MVIGLEKVKTPFSAPARLSATGVGRVSVLFPLDSGVAVCSITYDELKIL